MSIRDYRTKTGRYYMADVEEFKLFVRSKANRCYVRFAKKQAHKAERGAWRAEVAS